MDLKILYFLNNLTGKSIYLDGLFIFLASYLQYVLGVAFLLFLAFSRRKSREKAKIFAMTLGSVIVADFFIAEAIKLFLRRPRPFIVHNLNQLIRASGYSFPSGHAAFFFAFSTAIYCYNKKLGTWFFIASLLMAASRVIAGVHYLSDIAGGIILGSLAAFCLYSLVEKENQK